MVHVVVLHKLRDAVGTDVSRNVMIDSLVRPQLRLVQIESIVFWLGKGIPQLQLIASKMGILIHFLGLISLKIDLLETVICVIQGLNVASIRRNSI